MSASGKAGCENFRSPTSTRHSGCSPASVSITWADKRATNLSEVSGQRVGICRALIQTPTCFWATTDRLARSEDVAADHALIKELCAERKLSAIINIHDVMLAQMFAERIVGFATGEIVYDGPRTDLTPRS